MASISYTDSRLRAMAQPQAPDGLLRRVFNVAIATAGIVLSAPLMAAIALVVKVTSRGPVFYTQLRVGIDRRTRGDVRGDSRRLVDHGGKLFTIYKFRTMAMAGNGAGDGTEVWATPQDLRTTRIGRVLRAYRLDELPQLINVLRGDMNVVGPRPEQPAIFARLRPQIAGYQERQHVRPGITGWAQVNQPYDRSIDDVQRKVAFDLEYIGRRSVLEDLKIIMRTVPVVLLRRGAW
jgi:lipopolysaccharide/colanic/teichoic acid biosynthesis glycosyltransferase